MHLRSPKVKSVATYLELAKDPTTNFNAIEVLAPSLDRGTAIATRLAALPQVSHVMTVRSFIPEQQEEKLAADQAGGGHHEPRAQSAAHPARRRAMRTR